MAKDGVKNEPKGLGIRFTMSEEEVAAHQAALVQFREALPNKGPLREMLDQDVLAAAQRGGGIEYRKEFLERVVNPVKRKQSH